MKTHSSTPWDSLTAAARRAPSASGDAGFAADDQADCAAPLGFSARGVANARIGPTPTYGALFERLAARALGMACACALAMVVWGSMSTSAEAKSSELNADLYDPVGEVISATQS